MDDENHLCGSRSLTSDDGHRGVTSHSPDHPAGDPGRGTAWILTIIGIVLLGIWGCWWANSIREGTLTGLRHTWVPPAPNGRLGIDFTHNLDHPSRVWLAGGNPYQDDAVCNTFPYPPLVPRLFAWSSWLSPPTALVAWLAALTAMGAVGTVAAWRTRCSLSLAPIPLTLALAVIAYSTPFVFAMERANCDLLIIPLLVAACFLMKRRSTVEELVAGTLLALAVWTKVYPGLMVVGLLSLRRVRVLAGMAISGIAIGLTDVQGFARFVANNRKMVHDFLEMKRFNPVHPCEHSITECWVKLWKQTPLDRLASIPGSVAAAGILITLLGWVSYRVFRSPAREKLTFPYLLWVLAAATFVPPLASDYNLVFLPMVVLAVWDRRDPVLVHMSMGLLLLWWQPFQIPVAGSALLIFKLFGLVAMGVSLSSRMSELECCPEASVGVERGVTRPRSRQASCMAG